MPPSWDPAGSQNIINRKFNHDHVVPKLTNGTCCSSGGATLHDRREYQIDCNPSIKTHLMTNLASLDNKTRFINV